ncbi:hypothetical protein RhiirA5_420852 [Rhizophagus irregularis]|uniref:Uncharacterized protein n=1 Tax=Rhizophagus irregularis TaxID=588596 RepID=A0A2N0RDT3_9GLOM|nr:hypothetical protein RhiirA5_420852 [Rhizophagus irregularis]PKC61475.1 hypothetical protein RhiirA1_466496 [Rhizophagus irregularis]
MIIPDITRNNFEIALEKDMDIRINPTAQFFEIARKYELEEINLNFYYNFIKKKIIFFNNRVILRLQENKKLRKCKKTCYIYCNGSVKNNMTENICENWISLSHHIRIMYKLKNFLIYEEIIVWHIKFGYIKNFENILQTTFHSSRSKRIKIQRLFEETPTIEHHSCKISTSSTYKKSQTSKSAGGSLLTTRAPAQAIGSTLENAVPALIGQVTPGNEQISAIRGSPMGCFAATSMNAITRKSPVTISFFIVPLMSNGFFCVKNDRISSSGAALIAKSVTNNMNAKIKIRLMIT